MLDLCTGNGSLAVLAALAWPEVQVDARRPVARRAGRGAASTCDRHELQDRIRLLAVRRPARRCPARYDLILCNPPYVNSASMAQLPPEYRAEPELALAGGADGMDFIRAPAARTRPRA